MDLSTLAEERIREALERGEFDNLEGAGRKIDLTEYFNTPSEFRVGHSLLRSNKFIPAEVELMREIGELREACANAAPSLRADRLRLLNEKRMALAIVLERNHAGSRRR
ncbi:MAG: DUF1992 domain-containing protein [Acidobacteriota bacterium]|nr:MAG: DUF1992 domain-containing protein [Acidobacteriota bacterium]